MRARCFSPPAARASITQDRQGRDAQSDRNRGGQKVFLEYDFTDVMVESIQWSGSSGGDDTPTESVSFAFAKVTIKYSLQDTVKGTHEGRQQCCPGISRKRRKIVTHMNSRQLFDAGKLNAAIEALGSELRDNPTDTQRRTFLFELLCFAGNHDRAEKQLDIFSSGGPDARHGRAALPQRAACGALRADMFRKQTFPLDTAPDGRRFGNTQRKSRSPPSRMATRASARGWRCLPRGNIRGSPGSTWPACASKLPSACAI